MRIGTLVLLGAPLGAVLGHAIAGSAGLLLGPRLHDLAPHRCPILADHSIRIGLNIARATIAAVTYAVAHAAGLADFGKRVGHAEQSVTRGEGNPCLGDVLKKDAEGKWG